MHEPFLEALAKPEPVPGGGAAAAYGALVGMALLEKIVRLEFQRQPLTPEIRSRWEQLLEQVGSQAEALLRLRDEDGEAYMRFAEARGSRMEEEAVAAALEQAVDSPLKIMGAAHEALGCAFQAAKHCKQHLLSDLLVVCELLVAAMRGTYRIVEANLLVMADSTRKGDYQRMAIRLLEKCSDSFQQVEGLILARRGATGQ
jgi:formiminotetrahydrofolate cyclodeaminase